MTRNVTHRDGYFCTPAPTFFLLEPLHHFSSTLLKLDFSQPPSFLDALSNSPTATLSDMASSDMASLQTALAQFAASDPPPAQPFVRALADFLARPAPPITPITWIPPADELEIRLDLVRNLYNQLCHRDSSWQFTAAHVSALVLMPSAVISRLISECNSDNIYLRTIFLSVYISAFRNLTDMLRYCESRRSFYPPFLFPFFSLVLSFL